jgi:hypothetical protein
MRLLKLQHWMDRMGGQARAWLDRRQAGVALAKMGNERP